MKTLVVVTANKIAMGSKVHGSPGRQQGQQGQKGQEGQQGQGQEGQQGR